MVPTSASGQHGYLPSATGVFLAEFGGTLALVTLGAGAVILDHRSNGLLGPLVALAFGAVVAAVIYAVGQISGAHINPAVTLGLTMTRYFSSREIPAYWSAQFLGATAGALLLRASFGTLVAAAVTLPHSGVALAFVSEVLLAFVLVSVVVVTCELRLGRLATAAAVGSTVTLGMAVASGISGASMNPARSLGPALASGLLANQWIYVTAPFLGAALAGLVFRTFGHRIR